MSELLVKIKGAAKSVGKRIVKSFLPWILIILLIIMLVAGFTYEITVTDGIYEDGDWSNVPFAASQFTRSITIDNEGNITASMTAKEIWEKMMENDSRVDEYLENAEQLLALMNAEVITNYPDTRPNPDEEIDWETINQDIESNKIQGIIKFRRFLEDGTSVRLTYATPEQFYGWVEEYNYSGSESAWNNAMTHFTIEEGVGNIAANGSTSGNLVSGADIIDMTSDISDAIVQAAYSTPSPGGNLCQAWVSNVYANAGLTGKRYGTAYLAAQASIVSTDMSSIPIGATVYGTGLNSNGAGHVGIYVGNGIVRDNQASGGSGVVKDSTIEEWLSWQTDVIDGKSGWLGWGWNGESVSTEVLESTSTQSTPQVEKPGSIDRVSALYNESDKKITTRAERADNTEMPPEYVDAIIDAAYSTPSVDVGLSQAWVRRVYANAGLPDVMYNNAYEAAQANIVSTDMSNIPVGAVVYGTGSVSGGHAGIYVGNNTVRHSIERNGQQVVVDSTLEEFLSWQNQETDGQVGWLGWGWQSLPTETSTGDGDSEEPTDEEPSEIEEPEAPSGEDDEEEIITQPKSYSVIVATWKDKEVRVESNDPAVTPSEEHTYQMTTQSINYKAFVSGYTMPFNYLWALTVTGRQAEFALAIADLVYGSEIEIAIYDNLTTETVETTHTYTVESTVTNEDGTQESVSNTYWRTDTTITRTNTIIISLYRADVWIVDYTQEYVYQVPEVEVSVDGPKDDGSGGTIVTTTTIEKNIYVASPANIIEKTDRDSEEPNFVTIFRSADYYEAYNNIISAPDWLYEILENNEDTADMVDLTKYLIYKATGKDQGVTSLDTSIFNPDNFSTVTEIVGGDIQEKVWNTLTGLGYSDVAVAGVLGNIHWESGGFDASAIESNGEGIGLIQWSGGRKQSLIAYANSKGVDWTDINTQIEFLVAEMTPGGGANGYASYNFMDRNGYTREDWVNATTPEEAAKAFCYTFERPGVPHIEERIYWANYYYEYFTQQSSNDETNEQENL